MFFTYNQNNSGGDFVIDAQRGISTFVIVEADDDVEADEKAEKIGLYWDGVAEGRDCECCGDRWNRQWSGGTNVPMVYDKSVEDGFYRNGYFFTDRKNAAGYIHYKDGLVKEVYEIKDGD